VVFCQRPPRDRPPADQLNHECFADRNIPSFVPTLAPSTAKNLYCPQSDTTFYLVARWLIGFSSHYPDVVIDAPVIGSGIAGPCLADSSCELSIIAREMLLNELHTFKHAWGYQPLGVPVAGGSYAALAFTDAMTAIVHPANPLTQLSFAQFDAIFSVTRNRGYITDISTWGQLGLKGIWEDKPIHLVGVQIPNGFEYFLNMTILLGGTWKTNIETRPTVFELATIVSKDPYSMGYTGLAYLNATVTELALFNGGGWPFIGSGEDKYFSPVSKQNICTRDYPLSRLIYLFTNKKPGEGLDPVVLEFLNYILSYEGQKAVEDDQIFYPLPFKVLMHMRRELGLI